MLPIYIYIILRAFDFVKGIFYFPPTAKADTNKKGAAETTPQTVY